MIELLLMAETLLLLAINVIEELKREMSILHPRFSLPTLLMTMMELATGEVSKTNKGMSDERIRTTKTTTDAKILLHVTPG